MPKRKCEIQVESGDVFKDGDKKISLEISEDLRRYLANPEGWFRKFLKKESK